MSAAAEWMFILGLILPPLAVVLAAAGLLLGSSSGRRSPVKPASQPPTV
jgi:hypothetical protein